MWIIIKDEIEHRWSNQRSDDFLQFLPGHFGCNSGDLQVFWEENGNRKALEKWPYDGNGKFLGNKLQGE